MEHRLERRVTEAVADQAQSHLQQARRSRSAVSKRARPVLLPALIADHYLKALSGRGFDPFHPELQRRPPSDVWRLALGYLLGWWLARLYGFDANHRLTLAIEIGMQNAGLGVALALKHFAPETALPGALFAFWCILTAAGASSWLRRRPAEPVPGT